MKKHIFNVNNHMAVQSQFSNHQNYRAAGGSKTMEVLIHSADRLRFSQEPLQGVLMAQFPQERSNLLPAFIIVFVLKHCYVRVFLRKKDQDQVEVEVDIVGF